MVQGTSQAAVAGKSQGEDDLGKVDNDEKKSKPRKPRAARREDDLATVDEASNVLRLSPEFLYKLPKSTPGVHRFGRILRFDITALKRWAQSQAEGSAK